MHSLDLILGNPLGDEQQNNWPVLGRSVKAQEDKGGRGPVLDRRDTVTQGDRGPARAWALKDTLPIGHGGHGLGT